MSRMTFTVAKSFGRLQLIPEFDGLRLVYAPIVNGQLDYESLGCCDLLIPIDAVGGLWATSRAFLYGVESLDENIILRGEEGDVLVKLYRDKPRGSQGALSGDEVSWLRIVSGRSEEERRRIKLGPRDLLCIELACNAVLALSVSAGGASDGSRVSSNGLGSEVPDDIDVDDDLGEEDSVDV
ncbi:MAG: hypothetical protein IT291_05520 [Deltaproteobacteria bacterium]|nr:hypothetical protein [Deltaproteobacteria bacterium]